MFIVWLSEFALLSFGLLSVLVFMKSRTGRSRTGHTQVLVRFLHFVIREKLGEGIILHFVIGVKTISQLDSHLCAPWICMEDRILARKVGPPVRTVSTFMAEGTSGFSIAVRLTEPLWPADMHARAHALALADRRKNTLVDLPPELLEICVRSLIVRHIPTVASLLKVSCALRATLLQMRVLRQALDGRHTAERLGILPCLEAIGAADDKTVHQTIIALAVASCRGHLTTCRQ